MIIAVDFDGTLCEEKYPDIGEPNVELINMLCEMHTKGHELILWTCRSGTLLDNAIEWCRLHGLVFDTYNTNLPRVIEKYKGRDSRKITYDILIDDKNTSPKQFIDKFKTHESNGKDVITEMMDEIFDHLKKKITERIDSEVIPIMTRIPLPHMVSDNGQQYLTLGEEGNYFLCAYRADLKQSFTIDELENIPEEYKQFIPALEVSYEKNC